MDKKYDVALSYASDDSEYVQKVVDYLKNKNIRLYYDKDKQIEQWGTDLAISFRKTFKEESKFVILFISKSYARKYWTIHEFRSALETSIYNNEYILPARFDDTQLNGLNTNISYIDLRNHTPENFAEIIFQKVSHQANREDGDTLSNSIINNNNNNNEIIEIGLINEKNEAVTNANVMLILPNGTYEQKKTSSEGIVTFNTRKDKIYTAFISHESYAAAVVANLSSGFGASLMCRKGSSMISLGNWDNIINLNGSINPIHDDSNRLYVYTKNLSINNTCDHPFHFNTNQWLTIEDFSGNCKKISFKSVIGNCFLIDIIENSSTA